MSTDFSANLKGFTRGLIPVAFATSSDLRLSVLVCGFHYILKRKLFAWMQIGASLYSARFMIHAGIGYDVHPLVVGRKLVLGGVEIPHRKGLDGHSDADALMHALCDAVLGALGEGDIGQFFPNSDPRWRGVASKLFLQEAARQVIFRNGRIINVDATLIAQEPKLMPYAEAMKLNIAAALGIHPKKVGIKATTNELLGFIGREEGIAAMAVASVDLPDAT
jgi:2-C-methyl-D-erythritol 2,4-cyclodiphosphate synthase